MKLPGMKKDLKPIPVFKQNEGEKNRQFFRRVNQQVTVSTFVCLIFVFLLSVTTRWFCIIILFQQFLKQKSYEAKYNVDLVKDTQSGQTKFVQREKDELDEHVDNLKAKKLAKKGIIVKSKEEKRKEKRLKEKEKRMKKKRKSFKQIQLKEEFDDTPEQLGTI